VSVGRLDTSDRMMMLILGVPNIILLFLSGSSGVAPQPEQQSSPQLW